MAGAPVPAVDSYARQGYALHPRFLAQAQMVPLRAACDRVLARQRAAGDGRDTTNIAFLTDARWHGEDGEDLRALLEFIAAPRVTALIAAAAGVPLFHNTQYFMEPRTRSWTGAWHRDCQFLGDTPAAEDVVRAQARGVHFRVALVDDDYLEFVPGSQRRADSALEHAARWPRDGRLHDGDLPGAVRLRLRAGDALLFDPWGIHRGRYQAGTPRRTLDLLYDLGAPPASCPADCFAAPVPLAGLSPAARGFFATYNATRGAHAS